MNELQKLPETAQKRQKADSSILLTAAALTLGILVSMLCLASITWAWFTGTVSGRSETFNSATYTVVATVTSPQDTPLTQAADGSFSLQANTQYSVALIAGGSAQKSGYCVVRLPGESLHTQQFSSGETFHFTLILPQDGAVSFSPEWGTYSGIAEIAPNGQIGTLVPPEEMPADDPDKPPIEDAPEPPTDGEPTTTPQIGEAPTTELPQTEPPQTEP